MNLAKKKKRGVPLHHKKLKITGRTAHALQLPKSVQLHA